VDIVVGGDLFTSGMQTWVNPVNCVGIMGKGLALAFRQRFPAMYADYRTRCWAGTVRLGEPYLFIQEPSPWIINFPTKRHWRARSRLVDIEAGLDYLVRHAPGWGVTSLAVPALGCGAGQLAWDEVEPILLRALSQLEPAIRVAVYPPQSELLDLPGR
jgi:O-acetyl-ADP-ribose deacetylase (regulator of RNase III)